jgi:lipoate-protein ligase B
LIVPCGIAGKRATSLEKILDAHAEIKEVAPRITAHLGELLGLDLRPVSLDEVDAALRTHEDGLVFCNSPL